MVKDLFASFYAIILMSAALLQTGCESSMKTYFESIYTSDIYESSGYDLTSPDTILNLSPLLREISGLSYLDDSHLAVVQDEVGKMYVINLIDGSIEHEVKFGKNGDYEGIELVDRTVHVIKSNGNIYRFELDLIKDEVESEVIKTAISSRNDVEGLAYDAENNRLLIACKGQADVDGNEAKGKSIYAFDLHTLKLKEKPVYSIKKKDVAKIIEDEYPDMKLSDGIGPSGIAIHPFSGKTYLLTHVGKALIILNKEGEIEKYYPLNPSIFHQPEGICFSPQGDLFISNEARSKRPNIMKFSYQDD